MNGQDAGQVDSSPPDLAARVASLRKQGEDVAAVALLESARVDGRSPPIAALLGLAYMGAGRFVAAERSLIEALDATADDFIESHRSGLGLALEGVGAHIGWIDVECAVPGAKTHLAGEDYRCGEPVRAEVGQATVEIRASGYRSTLSSADVSTGDHSYVSVVLEPHECPSLIMMHIGGDHGACCWPECRRPRVRVVGPGRFHVSRRLSPTTLMSVGN